MPSFFGDFHTPRVKLPEEFSSKEAFHQYLGLSTAELKKIWWYRERMYKQFPLAKKNGKNRLISAPDKRLKFLQGRLLLLLNQVYRARNPVHGFVFDRSVKTNAEAHLQKRYVLNIDLKDFFLSITEKRIVGLLESLGIDTEVACIAARLCCLNSRLPQGAPTSPILSNMICFRLDKRLQKFSKENRFIYTRYADDITLSSQQPMTSMFKSGTIASGSVSPDDLNSSFVDIISGNGFHINPQKVHYADRNSRRIVTGIKVNELLNLDRRYVRNIRAALYSVNTLGQIEAQRKFEDVHGGDCDLGRHLRGKITWLGHVRGRSDPVFRSIARRFNGCYPEMKIETVPTAKEVRNRAVWVIEHFEGDWAQGTAFFLKGVGLVTAAHCVKGAEKIKIYHPEKYSNEFDVHVVKINEDLDLAVLHHSIPTTEFYEFDRTTKDVAVGDELIALGYPEFGAGDRLNVKEGKVNSLPVKSLVAKIDFSQKLVQGMSGGPLVTHENEVAGIIHKGGPTETKDLAINVAELLKWLAEGAA